MVTIYREKNRFKRAWNAFVEAFEESWLKRWWQRQFFTTEIAGQEMNFIRIRWWPIVGPLTVWLGHNIFLIAWYMVSAIAGRTVSFDASGWWYWPLRTFFQIS